MFDGSGLLVNVSNTSLSHALVAVNINDVLLVCCNFDSRSNRVTNCKELNPCASSHSAAVYFFDVMEAIST